jgi:hypothetical protein
MRHYYLRQRTKDGKWYVTIMNTITKKPELFRCTGTYDEKQADRIAQEWLFNRWPDSNKVSSNIAKLRYSVFCDYLNNFWNYDSSEYIKEKITEGNQPYRRHTLDMQGIIERYYKPYFKQTLLCEITEEKLTVFLVYLRTEKSLERKTKKGLAASTCKHVKIAAIVPLRFAK